MNGLDWNAIYLTCFGIGLVMTVVVFITGAGHMHFGHFHVGHGHAGGHAALRATGRGAGGRGAQVSPINGFTGMAFLCWFGGSGYLLHRHSVFVAPVIFALATLTGLAGASVLFWFLSGVLARNERTLQAADTEMVGVVGRLSSSLPVSAVGEMLFSQNGKRCSAAVRSDDGSAIERGAEVFVMRYERGVAYVRRWQEFEAGLLGTNDSRRDEKETPMREP